MWNHNLGSMIRSYFPNIVEKLYHRPDSCPQDLDASALRFQLAIGWVLRRGAQLR